MARRDNPAPPSPPVPDPAHHRKPRRAALYIPFILAGVAALAWSGAWVYARGEAAKRLEAGASGFAAARLIGHRGSRRGGVVAAGHVD